VRPLVSTDELAGRPEWRVFDCRFDLGKPELGEQQYAGAHIPGALYAHLDRDLSAPKSGTNGRHPLPDPAAFVAWLSRQGVRPTDTVVCYDAGGGVTASRLWWMLRWLGHESVAVLDGGYAKWVAEGRPVTAEVPSFTESAYEANPTPQMAVNASFVEKQLERSDVLLLDARAPARFRGEKEPIDPVAGRIPGARNRYFLDESPLPADLVAAPDLVVYCGSGVTACAVLYELDRAGRGDARLYPGSFSEWYALGPVERG